MNRIIDAKYLNNYKILITFRNGIKKIVDLEGELWGPMFEPLKDVNIFKQFRVDTEIHTIVWPNGADLAPDSLYESGAVCST